MVSVNVVSFFKALILFLAPSRLFSGCSVVPGELSLPLGETVNANPKTWTIQDGDAEPSTGLTDGDILYVWTD